MQCPSPSADPMRRLEPAPAPAGIRRHVLLGASAIVLLLGTFPASAADDAVPSFSATALTGRKVTAADLIGQPAVLILTPSKEAAGDTRTWAKALRDKLDRTVRVRDVLAIDLPFFMSESDAIGRAKDKIPARYYDQTWLMSNKVLESALDVPASSREAFVFVLDSRGHVAARVHGAATPARVSEIRSALQSLR